MSRVLTFTLSALMLSAPAAADTYNRSAMPKASATLQRQTADCKARWTAKDFTTYSEWQNCQLEVERGFFTAISLKKMDAFEAYAADLRTLAADRDANRVTDRQVRSKANEILKTLLADCECKPSRVFAGANRGYGWPINDNQPPSPYAVPSGAAAGASGGHPTPPPASPP